MEVAPLKYFVFIEQIGRPWRRIEVWASDTAHVLRHRIMACNSANSALKSDRAQPPLPMTTPPGVVPVTRGRFQILWRGAALDGDGTVSHALSGNNNNNNGNHRHYRSYDGPDTFRFGGNNNGYSGMHSHSALGWHQEDANLAAGFSRSAFSRTLSQLGVSAGATLELVPLPVVLHVRVPSLGLVNEEASSGGAPINHLQHSSHAQSASQWQPWMIGSPRSSPRGGASRLEAVHVHPDHGTPRDVLQALQPALSPHRALDENRCWLEDIAGQRLPFDEPLPNRVIVKALSVHPVNHTQFAEHLTNERGALAHSDRAQLCLAIDPSFSPTFDAGAHDLRASAQSQHTRTGALHSPQRTEALDQQFTAAVSAAVRDALHKEREEQEQIDDRDPLDTQHGHERSTSRHIGNDHRRTMHAPRPPADKRRLPNVDQYSRGMYRNAEVEEVKEDHKSGSVAEAEMAAFLANIGLEAFCPKLLEFGVGGMSELMRASDALLTAAGFYPSQLAAFHRAIGRSSVDRHHYNDDDDSNSSEYSPWEDSKPTRPQSPPRPRTRSKKALVPTHQRAKREHRQEPRAPDEGASPATEDRSKKGSSRSRRRPSSHSDSGRSNQANDDEHHSEDDKSAQKKAKDEADAVEASQKRAMAARAALEAEMQAEVAQRTAAAHAAAAEAEASARARTAAALAAAEEAEAAARTAAARGAADHAEALAKARTEAAIAALEQAEANAKLASVKAIASENIAPKAGTPATVEASTSQSNAVSGNDLKSTTGLTKDPAETTSASPDVASAAMEASTSPKALAVNNAIATAHNRDEHISGNSSSNSSNGLPEPAPLASGSSASHWKETVKEVVQMEAEIKHAAEALLIGAETGDENVAPPSPHQHVSDVALEALSKSRAKNNSAPQCSSNSPLASRKVQSPESMSLDGEEKSGISATSSPGSSATSVVLKRRESIGEAMRRKADEALDAKLLKQKARAEMKLLIAKKKGEVELSKVGTGIYLLLNLNSCVCDLSDMYTFSFNFYS